MTKITPTNKSLSDTPKKYCRVILTEDKPSWHRLVEADDGHLEYRMGAGKRKKPLQEASELWCGQLFNQPKRTNLNTSLFKLVLWVVLKLKKKAIRGFFEP